MSILQTSQNPAANSVQEIIKIKEISYTESNDPPITKSHIECGNQEF
jgi:hypothetical protein